MCAQLLTELTGAITHRTPNNASRQESQSARQSCNRIFAPRSWKFSANQPKGTFTLTEYRKYIKGPPWKATLPEARSRRRPPANAPSSKQRSAMLRFKRGSRGELDQQHSDGSQQATSASSSGNGKAAGKAASSTSSSGKRESEKEKRRERRETGRRTTESETNERTRTDNRGQKGETGTDEDGQTTGHPHPHRATRGRGGTGRRPRGPWRAPTTRQGDPPRGGTSFSIPTAL